MRDLFHGRALLPCLALAACAAFAQQKRDLKFEADPTAPAAPVAIPRSYALVVGIAKYPKLLPSAQLLYSERDADEIYATLISPEGGNFQNVRRLVGPKATLANIRRELEEWLPSVTREDDRVLVYFAGHGFLHGGKAYLAPHDFDPTDIPRTGYAMETLGKVFGSRIKGKWKVLLTDACHSGAITPDTAQSLNQTLSRLDSSLFSLTASRDREVSYEGSTWGGGHGVFTYFLKTGLEGAADESGDGIVTADELADYVYRNVRDATREAPQGMQNPNFGRGSFDSKMLLSYVPSRVRPGAPPPPKEGTLVVEVNMDGVEVFVDGKSMGVVNKAKPLTLPGLAAGARTIKGVRQGYEPDGPREETVYPGQATTVSIRILIPARRKKAAVELFDQGVEFYNKGFAENYKRAAERFEKALAAEPRYSQAALYLGRVYNALFEEERAEKSLRLAVEIDPDYLEARTALGAMLLDKGNTDESIRQLTAAVRRDPSYAQPYYLLAEAFRVKEQYPQAIEAARQAIQFTPNNAEAHFWLAEGLRMTGKHEEARTEYAAYLRLSDFDSGVAGKMSYWVRGFLIGGGKKRRATLQDIWRELRGVAYFGLCDCERLLSRFDAAIGYCQRALAYGSPDPLVHFALGVAYTEKAQATGELQYLPAAAKHFREQIRINPDLVESERARKYLAGIDKLLLAAR